MIDESLATPPPHRCSLPHVWSPIRPDDTRRRHGYEVFLAHPLGSRYTCAGCGEVWVLVDDGDEGPSWLPETWEQRRARLGIPWWKFWA